MNKRATLDTVLFIAVFFIGAWNIYLSCELSEYKKHPDKIEIFLEPADSLTDKFKQLQEKYNTSIIVSDYENSQINESLNILSTTSNLFGKVLTVVAIFITLLAGIGLFQVNYWRNLRMQMEAGEGNMKHLKQQIEISTLLVNQKKNEFEQILEQISKSESELKNKMSTINQKYAEQEDALGKLINELNSKQKSIIAHGLKLKEFQDDLSVKYERYKKQVFDILDEIKEIKDANAKNSKYSAGVKAKLQKLKTFHSYFELFVDTNETDEESVRLKNVEYFALGMSAYFDKEYEESRGFFQKAVEYDDQDYISYMRLATIHFYLEEYPAAIAAFEKSILIQPDFYVSFYNMGHAYKKMGQFDNAIKYYEKAIEIKSDYIPAYNNLIFAYIKNDELEKAMSKIDNVLELDGNNEKAYYNKACIFSRQKNKQESLVNLGKALTLQPSLKAIARTDKDFLWLREDTQFINLFL